MDRVQEIIYRILVDTTGLREQVEAAKAKIRELENANDNLGRKQDGANSSTEKLSKSQKDLAKSLDETAKNVDKLDRKSKGAPTGGARTSDGGSTTSSGREHNYEPALASILTQLRECCAGMRRADSDARPTSAAPQAARDNAAKAAPDTEHQNYHPVLNAILAQLRATHAHNLVSRQSDEVAAKLAKKEAAGATSGPPGTAHQGGVATGPARVNDHDYRPYFERLTQQMKDCCDAMGRAAGDRDRPAPRRDDRPQNVEDAKRRELERVANQTNDEVAEAGRRRLAEARSNYTPQQQKKLAKSQKDFEKRFADFPEHLLSVQPGYDAALPAGENKRRYLERERHLPNDTDEQTIYNGPSHERQLARMELDPPKPPEHDPDRTDRRYTAWLKRQGLLSPEAPQVRSAGSGQGQDAAAAAAQVKATEEAAKAQHANTQATNKATESAVRRSESDEKASGAAARKAHVDNDAAEHTAKQVAARDKEDRDFIQAARKRAMQESDAARPARTPFDWKSASEEEKAERRRETSRASSAALRARQAAAEEAEQRAKADVESRRGSSTPPAAKPEPEVVRGDRDGDRDTARPKGGDSDAGMALSINRLAAQLGDCCEAMKAASKAPKSDGSHPFDRLASQMKECCEAIKKSGGRDSDSNRTSPAGKSRGKVDADLEEAAATSKQSAKRHADKEADLDALHAKAFEDDRRWTAKRHSDIERDHGRALTLNEALDRRTAQAKDKAEQKAIADRAANQAKIDRDHATALREVAAQAKRQAALDKRDTDRLDRAHTTALRDNDRFDRGLINTRGKPLTREEKGERRIADLESGRSTILEQRLINARQRGVLAAASAIAAEDSLASRRLVARGRATERGRYAEAGRLSDDIPEYRRGFNRSDAGPRAAPPPLPRNAPLAQRIARRLGYDNRIGEGQRYAPGPYGFGPAGRIRGDDPDFQTTRSESLTRVLRAPGRGSIDPVRLATLRERQRLMREIAQDRANPTPDLPTLADPIPTPRDRDETPEPEQTGRRPKRQYATPEQVEAARGEGPLPGEQPRRRPKRQYITEAEVDRSEPLPGQEQPRRHRRKRQYVLETPTPPEATTDATDDDAPRKRLRDRIKDRYLALEKRLQVAAKQVDPNAPDPTPEPKPEPRRRKRQYVTGEQVDRSRPLPGEEPTPRPKRQYVRQPEAPAVPEPQRPADDDRPRRRLLDRLKAAEKRLQVAAKQVDPDAPEPEPYERPAKHRAKRQYITGEEVDRSQSLPGDEPTRRPKRQYVQAPPAPDVERPAADDDARPRRRRVLAGVRDRYLRIENRLQRRFKQIEDDLEETDKALGGERDRPKRRPKRQYINREETEARQTPEPEEAGRRPKRQYVSREEMADRDVEPLPEVPQRRPKRQYVQGEEGSRRRGVLDRAKDRYLAAERGLRERFKQIDHSDDTGAIELGSLFGFGGRDDDEPEQEPDTSPAPEPKRRKRGLTPQPAAEEEKPKPKRRSLRYGEEVNLNQAAAEARGEAQRERDREYVPDPNRPRIDLTRQPKKADEPPEPPVEEQAPPRRRPAKPRKPDSAEKECEVQEKAAAKCTEAADKVAEAREKAAEAAKSGAQATDKEAEAHRKAAEAAESGAEATDKETAARKKAEGAAKEHANASRDASAAARDEAKSHDENANAADRESEARRRSEGDDRQNATGRRQRRNTGTPPPPSPPAGGPDIPDIPDLPDPPDGGGDDDDDDDDDDGGRGRRGRGRHRRRRQRRSRSGSGSGGRLARVGQGFAGAGQAAFGVGAAFVNAVMPDDGAKKLSRMQVIIGAILTLLIALIPVIASLTAVLGAFLSAATAAFGAVAVFALAAIVNIKKFSAALQEANGVTSFLPKYMQEAGNAMNKFKEAFSDFGASTSSGVFEVITKGLNLISGLLPRLIPIANAASQGISAAIDDIGKTLAGGRFNTFLKFLKTEGPGAIQSFIASLSNIAAGIGELALSFQPYIQWFLKGFERMTAGFNRWAQSLSGSAKFKEFMDYAKTEGPKVMETFGALISLVIRVGVALAPFGEALLAVIRGMSALADALPLQSLRILLGLFIAMGVIKVISILFVFFGRTVATVDLFMRRFALGIGVASTSVVGLTGAIRVATIALRVMQAATIIGLIFTVAATAISLFTAVTEKATDATVDFSAAQSSLQQALAASGGKIDENIRKLAILALKENGVLDAGRKAGLTDDEIVNSYLGTDDDFNTVIAKKEAENKKLDETTDDTRRARTGKPLRTKEEQQQYQANEEFIKVAKKNHNEYAQNAIDEEAATNTAHKLEAAERGVSEESLRRRDAVEKASAATNEQTKRVQAAVDAYKALAVAAEESSDAERTYQRAVEDNSTAQERATLKLQRAELTHADAMRRVTEAQKKLNDAREEAALKVEDYQRKLRDLPLDEEQNSISLARAQENLQKVMNDAAASDLDRRQALLDLQRAQNTQRDGVFDGEVTRREAGREIEKGVENNDDVLQAQRDLTDAILGAKEANLAFRDAQLEVKRALEDSTEAVSDSATALQSAKDKAAEANEQFSTFAATAGYTADQIKRIADNQGLLKEQFNIGITAPGLDTIEKKLRYINVSQVANDLLTKNPSMTVAQAFAQADKLVPALPTYTNAQIGGYQGDPKAFKAAGGHIDGMSVGERATARAIEGFMPSGSHAGASRVAGQVDGAGTGVSDSVPAWLSVGEHVWTAAETMAIGGHKMMEDLRQAVKAGRFTKEDVSAFMYGTKMQLASGGPAYKNGVRGYASGGAVDYATVMVYLADGTMVSLRQAAEGGLPYYRNRADVGRVPVTIPKTKNPGSVAKPISDRPSVELENGKAPYTRPYFPGLGTGLIRPGANIGLPTNNRVVGAPDRNQMANYTTNRGMTMGNITINNPVSEPSGQSLYRTVRRLALEYQDY